MSLICETVRGRSMAELLAARDRATAGDMIELRLDGVADLDVAGALRGRRCPVVVTCRPQWEGGSFAGSEDERRTVLGRALELGAEFVDVEWRARFDDLVGLAPERVVVSMHDFEGVPADLDDAVRAMRGTGAHIVKVAITAARLTDTLRLRDIGRGGNAVVIGMGGPGLPSRLLAARYGSCWTYSGNTVAPGQLPATRMLDEFRFRSIGPATRLFGVVSTNAMHSASPAMHNAAFAAAGIDAVYVPLQAFEFSDFLTFADAIGIEGASVTIPFKLDALRAAATSDDTARTVGAANTLRRRGDVWDAANTDVAGFLEPLDAALGPSLSGARAAVLGAGGSARAVVVALKLRDVRVTVHARRSEQAQETAASTGVNAGSWPPPAGSWDLLVNCTPMGGAGRRHDSPVPGGPFGGRFVYDLTYGPGESELLREARLAGCLTLDGLPMLVAQAERQFEWWTGQRPAAGVMLGAARRRLSTEASGDTGTRHSETSSGPYQLNL